MQNAKFKMQTLNRRPSALFAFCLLTFALLVSLTGCSAKAKAQTLPDSPPLAVPIAPAHEITIEQIAEAAPEEPEPAPEPVAPKPLPAAQKIQTNPKPRADTTPPANQPAATATQPTPSEAQVIRAAPAAAAGDEKKVRDLLAKASTDLSKRVDYQKLSDEGKQQYNQSKRFSEEAEQAIKERNLPYALSLAEKAANMAAELVR